MAKIKIITDGGSDIKNAVAQRLGIRVIPIDYTFDGENYLRSEVDQTRNEFYEQLKASPTPPKTTQVTPISFEEIFREEAEKGYDTIIHVSISSNGSGMYQNACLAARQITEETGCDIRIVDSHAFTCIYGQPVIHAAKMAQNGESADAVVEYLTKAVEDFRAVFAVDSLEHLLKGGRINKGTVLFANMLDIKPLLTVRDGLVVQFDKVRGERRVYKKIIEKMVSDCPDFNGKTVITVNTMADEKLQKLEAELKNAFPDVNIVHCNVGTIVGSHIGPSLYGFTYSSSGEFDLSDYTEE